MTAGSGVQHSEMFPLVHEHKANPLELFQIWMNLPSRNKMVEPHFAMLWNEDTPIAMVESSTQEPVRVKVVAGTYVSPTGDATHPLSPPPDSWAGDANNHVAIWLIDLPVASNWTLPADVTGLNRTVYFFEGENIRVDGEVVSVAQALRLESANDVEFVGGDAPARILLLQGKAIGEPVAQHGPFVMNTRQELQQAFFDFQRTQFGGWPWPEHDQTHGREIRRFAKHADGKEENPS